MQAATPESNQAQSNGPESIDLVTVESTPIVVQHRRFSKLPIIIPLPLPDSKTQAAELELLQLQEKFKGTTPQGREIVRKLLSHARKKLAQI